MARLKKLLTAANAHIEGFKKELADAKDEVKARDETLRALSLQGRR